MNDSKPSKLSLKKKKSKASHMGPRPAGEVLGEGEDGKKISKLELLENLKLFKKIKNLKKRQRKLVQLNAIAMAENVKDDITNSEEEDKATMSQPTNHKIIKRVQKKEFKRQKKIELSSNQCDSEHESEVEMDEDITTVSNDEDPASPVVAQFEAVQSDSPNEEENSAEVQEDDDSSKPNIIIPANFIQLFRDIYERTGPLSRIGIFGGQNSGKSTLAQWLANKFLFLNVGCEPLPLLYIDLDPGQPEFTPPGMISVTMCENPVGPAFIHLNQPLLSIFLGSTNMADIPLTYGKGVRKIYDFINNCPEANDLKNIPWIINTMGFTKGLGESFACEIIKCFQPNTLVQLNINIDKLDFSFDLTPKHVSLRSTKWINLGIREGDKQVERLDYSYNKINSVHCVQDTNGQSENQLGLKFTGINSKQKRDKAILSYFTRTVNSRKISDINFVVPYIITLDAIKVGVDENNIQCISYETVLRTMNGNLIALCQVGESLQNGNCTTDCETEKLGPELIDCTKSSDITCLGYGLVRAIDLRQRALFVITPVPQALLQSKVNCIVAAGKIGLPQQLFHLTNNVRGNQEEQSTPYLMNAEKHRINSKLHTPSKKYFVPNRVAAHKVLQNCLL